MNRKYIFISLGVLVLLGVVLGLFVYGSKSMPYKIQRENVFPLGEDEVVEFLDEGVSVVPELSENEDGILELRMFLKPDGGVVALSTFTVNLIIEGGRFSGENLVVSSDLSSKNWTFPIRNVEKTEDGDLEVKLGAVNLAIDALDIGEGVEVATVNFGFVGGDVLKMNVNERNTKFFSKQAERYRLAGDKEVSLVVE